MSSDVVPVLCATLEVRGSSEFRTVGTLYFFSFNRLHLSEADPKILDKMNKSVENNESINFVTIILILVDSSNIVI